MSYIKTPVPFFVVLISIVFLIPSIIDAQVGTIYQTVSPTSQFTCANGGTVECWSCSVSASALKIAGELDSRYPLERHYYENDCYQDFAYVKSYYLFGNGINGPSCTGVSSGQNIYVENSYNYCVYYQDANHQCSIEKKEGRDYYNNVYPVKLPVTGFVCDSSGGGGSGASFAISSTPTTASIQRTQSQTYTVKVTSSNGFSNAVNLTYSGCPSYSTCVYDRTTVTPPANGSTEAFLTVTSTNNTPTGNNYIRFIGTSGSITGTAVSQLYVGAGLNTATCDMSAVPNTIPTGWTGDVDVIVTNPSGGRQWTSGGANPYKLGMPSPAGNYIEYATWNTTAQNLPYSPVNAGETVTFRIPIRAPGTPGTYNFNWRMVEEGVAWFGDQCNKSIVVTNNTVNGACNTTTTSGTYSSPGPTTNLCTAGTPSAVTETSSSWTWTCTGSGTGAQSDSCQAPKTAVSGGISVVLSATPNAMNDPSRSTSLSWTTTGNPTSCSADGASPLNAAWSGTLSGTSKSVSGLAMGTNNFMIRCVKAGYPDATSQVNVVVNPQSQTGIDATFTATPSSMTQPIDDTMLNWTVTGNPTSCTASGSVPYNSSWTGTWYPTTVSSIPINDLAVGTHVFELTCSKAGVPDIKRAVSVNVNPISGINVSLTASNMVPRLINPSELQVRLTWNTSGGVTPDSCQAVNNGSWIGSKFTTGGNEDVYPLSYGNISYTYEIICSKSGYQPVRDSVTVVTPYAVPYVTISATPSTATEGGNTTVRAEYFGNPDTCTTSGEWSPPLPAFYGPSGSFQQIIYGLTQGVHTYTVTCSRPGVGSDTESATATVSAPAATLGVTLSASPSVTTLTNNSTQLSWVTSGSPDSCTAFSATPANAGWSGVLTGSQKVVGNLVEGNNSFTIRCTKTGYTAVTSVANVTVNASSGAGNATVSITADDTSLDSGQSTTVRWGYQNANSCTLDPSSIGSVAISAPPGSGNGNGNTGPLSTDRTYTISCLPGPVAASVTVAVDESVDTGTITVIKSGQGDVDDGAPGGIGCGSTCSASYENGISVTLTATPKPGRIFTGWGGACKSEGRNSDCTLVINGSQTVYANFAVDPSFKEF